MSESKHWFAVKTPDGGFLPSVLEDHIDTIRMAGRAATGHPLAWLEDKGYRFVEITEKSDATNAALLEAMKVLRNGAANSVEDGVWPSLQEYLFDADAAIAAAEEKS